MSQKANKGQGVKTIDLLPEIIALHKEYKAKRSQYKKAYNNYKKAYKKFYFIEQIENPNNQGKSRELDELFELAIKDLFNSIGIISKRPPNKDDFDVLSSFKDNHFGIEAKNGAGIPIENEMFQAIKYKKRDNRNLHAIVIWNNHASNQKFDEKRVKDAVANGYAILTAKELIMGYTKLKRGIISFEAFLTQLNKFGEIKFSGKDFFKSINSNAT